ncbi:MAG: zinc-dependent peptidase [Candidatus Competibacteraceae bacterium]|nr:zinc-dependent peptidase [Candidatus Competibacteraceae bacterium]MBK8899324.1 zinc-dependent peptidase [Candidatus Competibacteraceae bacterium]MBK9952321.1 zinc-dependent peptidase [Candidatus Competibacteraceae bacterium]
MLATLKNWLRRRRLARARIPDAQWRATVAGLPLLAGLSSIELERLRELASLFLAEKALEPAGGLTLSPEMGPLIAAQACLPILNLGLEYYRGWRSVILYPEGFLARHEYTDPLGLVHSVHRPLIGEAWERGPVILSWADIADTRDEPGLNVVVHEMAHKLDMLNGEVNGLPPLHRNMAVEDWSRAFNAAYRRLCREVDRGQPTVLDPYAAESPGEFFALISEAFFETPALVSEIYPAVYQQLQAFYRQDPLTRLPDRGNQRLALTLADSALANE